MVVEGFPAVALITAATAATATILPRLPRGVLHDVPVVVPGLEFFYACNALVMGVYAIVESGELPRDAAEFGRHLHRIGQGAGHGGRCTRGGL
jgi:hypothetical protein